MSAKKNSHSPGWFEVGLGAFLSIVIGTFLGAALLVTRPVQKVKEVPKDAPPNAVYLIEGGKDFGHSADAAAKRKAFAEGESVDITEGELNVVLSSLFAPPAPKPGEKAPEPKLIDTSSLNARIAAGKLQLSSTVTLSFQGVAFTYIVQAEGTFEKHSGRFVFSPSTFYVGSCPFHRVPFVGDYLAKKLLFDHPVPDELVTAWSKLSDVGIVGDSLRLKLP
jgi:hypothetical protein